MLFLSFDKDESALRGHREKVIFDKKKVVPTINLAREIPAYPQPWQWYAATVIRLHKRLAPLFLTTYHPNLPGCSIF